MAHKWCNHLPLSQDFYTFIDLYVLLCFVLRIVSKGKPK